MKAKTELLACGHICRLEKERKSKGRGVNTIADWRGLRHRDAKSSIFEF